MNILQTMIAISTALKSCETDKELERVREEVRPLVKKLPKEHQKWCYLEYISRKRVLELPSVSEKELEKILRKEGDGFTKSRKKHEGSRKQDRGGWKKVRKSTGIELSDARAKKDSVSSINERFK